MTERSKTPAPEIEPTYGPLLPTCAAFGLKKTRVHALVRSGLLRTALIGGRRFVYLDSLRTLPERMAAEAANDSAGGDS